MSRFFRTGSSSENSDSDSAGEEDEESTEEVLNQSLSQLPPQDFSGASLESIAIDRSDPNAQDFLVHALLEERCMNEVLKERNAIRNPRQRLSDDEVQREAQRRYQLLCAQLAPMNLVSQGLEQDRHGATRQRVREGLDRLLQSGNPQPSFPGPLRRLLTDSTTQNATSFNNLASLHQPVASRYLKDYDELGPLGKGGYGEVSFNAFSTDAFEFGTEVHSRGRHHRCCLRSCKSSSFLISVSDSIISAHRYFTFDIDWMPACTLSKRFPFAHPWFAESLQKVTPCLTRS